MQLESSISKLVKLVKQFFKQQNQYYTHNDIFFK
jgi:hypothetical protein